MSALQVLGALLVASPFVVVAVIVVRDLGWSEMFIVYGLTALTVLVVAVGVALMSGGLA